MDFRIPNVNDSAAGLTQPVDASGVCVLLVEDEDAIRRLARKVLTRQGYSVVEAADPTQAIGLARERPRQIDLILTDVMMPGMRGWEMVDRLRDYQPNAKVLYISGYVNEVDSTGERVRPLLPKPFKPSDLLAAIRRLLEQR